MKAVAALAPLLLAPRTPTPVVAPPALSAPVLPGAAAPVPSSPFALPASAPTAAPPSADARPAVRASAAPAVTERPAAGLLVVDIADSTRMFQELGNRKAQSTADAVMDFAAETARALGGVVARRLGDGLLIAFPDRVSAVRAGLAVQGRVGEVRERLGRPGLSLHAAAHGGIVIEERAGRGYDVYGHSVERVLALPSLGPTGTLVLDGAMLRDIGVAAAVRGRVSPGPDGTVSAAPVPGDASGQGAWGQGDLAVTRLARRATLFADLEGFTAEYGRLGRLEAYRRLKGFHAFAASVVAAHGGALVKTSGESVMASFRDPAAALRAGAALRRGAFGRPVRVGLSYGRVVREETLEGTDYFGNTVNAAARLMRKASGGGLLVSPALLRDAGARGLLESARTRRVPMELKGFPSPFEALLVDEGSVRP